MMCTEELKLQTTDNRFNFCCVWAQTGYLTNTPQGTISVTLSHLQLPVQP